MKLFDLIEDSISISLELLDLYGAVADGYKNLDEKDVINFCFELQAIYEELKNDSGNNIDL